MLNSLDLCGRLARVSGDRPGERQDGGEETGTFQERERLLCGKGENGQIRPCGEVAQAKATTPCGARPSPKHRCCVLPQTGGHRPGPGQESRPRRSQMLYKEIWLHPASCLHSCVVTPGNLWPSKGFCSLQLSKLFRGMGSTISVLL